MRVSQVQKSHDAHGASSGVKVLITPKHNWPKIQFLHKTYHWSIKKNLEWTKLNKKNGSKIFLWVIPVNLIMMIRKKLQKYVGNDEAVSYAQQTIFLITHSKELMKWLQVNTSFLGYPDCLRILSTDILTCEKECRVSRSLLFSSWSEEQ